jgi:NitT/TauT family transport system substrate-binding protein
MIHVCFSLLRGVCQIPAYLAHEKGFFQEERIESEIQIASTAALVPAKLSSGESQFAVLPWTRVAAAGEKGVRLTLLCGSGHEEAAMVVRKGVSIPEVKKIAVPLRGGMKDLTAMGLLKSLGWEEEELLRQPSGDGTIIALFGQGVDAASMVEPYATMLEDLGVGTVVRRTGDVWPGAPGCSLATTDAFKHQQPEVVQSVVRAFVRAAQWIREQPEEAAEIAHRYIGIHPRFIVHALEKNQPRVDAIRNEQAMEQVLTLMLQLGYLKTMPAGFMDLSFLDKAVSENAHS